MEIDPYVFLLLIVVVNPAGVDALFGTHEAHSGASGYAAKLSIAVVLGTLHHSRALIQFAEIPPEIHQCWVNYTNEASTLWQAEHKVVMTEEKIHMRCMEQFVLRPDTIKWSQYGVSDDDLAWVNSLLVPMIQPRRRKRDWKHFGPEDIGPDDKYPPSGIRVRREYRRLTDAERDAYHTAVKVLKQSGRFDILAKIHYGTTRLKQVHCGPNFFAWHRIFITIMEEALRQIDRYLAIPYWDSSLDTELDNPIDSIIWSPPFLGNGDGYVTSGPFANWTFFGKTRLLRNYGSISTPMLPKEYIRRVMSRCRTWEISVPLGITWFNLEFYHGGPHNWVGGHMSSLDTAPHDPLFYMHHSFIDYLWTDFQVQQHERCHVDPNTDYPHITGKHAADQPLPGFPQYLAIDGFQTYWASQWYRYERAPFCSKLVPDCGTPYLRCDVEKGRCVTEVRYITAKGPTGELITAPPSSFKSLTVANYKRAMEEEEDAVIEGKRFVIPNHPEDKHPNFCPEERHLYRRRRSVEEKLLTNAISQDSSSNRQSKFESAARSHASNERSGFSVTHNMSSDSKTFSPPRHLSFPFSVPRPLLPSIGSPVASTPWGSRSQWQHGNAFSKYTTSMRIKELAYIPTKIIYQALSRTKQQPTAHAHSSHGAPLRRTCKKNATGSINVIVHAQGLNYVGSHRNMVIVDSRFGESSAITYVAVKKPEMGASEVLLSAFDECGNVCHPECISDGTDPVEYRPCTGVLKVTSQHPTMYAQTGLDALRVISRKSLSEETGRAEKIRIIFRCLSSVETEI